MMMRDERVLALAIHFIPAIQSQSLILPFVGFPLFSSEKKSNNHVDLNLLEATLLEQNSENAFDTKLTLHQCLWCCHTPFWFALFLYIYLLFCAGRERERLPAWHERLFFVASVCLSHFMCAILYHATTRQKGANKLPPTNSQLYTHKYQ